MPKRINLNQKILLSMEFESPNIHSNRNLLSKCQSRPQLFICIKMRLSTALNAHDEALTPALERV